MKAIRLADNDKKVVVDVGRSKARTTAIAAEYWRKGVAPEVAAERMHTSVRHVRNLYEYVEWTEAPGRVADRPPPVSLDHAAVTAPQASDTA